MTQYYFPTGVAPASLQAAYDSTPAAPQIVLDNVPNVLTIRGGVAAISKFRGSVSLVPGTGIPGLVP